jgi:hypothetical protein
MESKFKELFYLESIDSNDFTTEMENNFIFCGRNWWFYFTSKVNDDCEKFENVEFRKWDFNKKDPTWIDYDSELDLNLIYS